MALVSSFVEPATLPAAEPRSFDVIGASDSDLLLEALDEVIFGMDTSDRVPISATVTKVGSGLSVACRCGDVRAAGLIGSVPKAVSWHELEFSGSADVGWRCRVTIDI